MYIKNKSVQYAPSIVEDGCLGKRACFAYRSLLAEVSGFSIVYQFCRDKNVADSIILNCMQFLRHGKIAVQILISS
jgi:hypothetical protein